MSRDPNKEIDDLKVELASLKLQVATPGLDKDRELAIRQEIIAFSNQLSYEGKTYSIESDDPVEVLRTINSHLTRYFNLIGVI